MLISICLFTRNSFMTDLDAQPHTTMPYNMQSYVKDQGGGWVTPI